ncbi:hypothetical protein FRC12_003498 [Ceratobasidium sp. 428]|nr:hypothetical protein FRC12_003498 [Ceratobasidium sp. 428]
MHLIPTAFFLAALASSGAAMWNQCGGIGWTGSTECGAGSVCSVINPYYSQCIPSTSSSSTKAPVTPTPTPTPTTTSTTTPTSICGPFRVAGALMPRTTGPPIHALDGWAKNTWLQVSKTSSAATLGPASSRGWFLPNGIIRLIGWGCPQFTYFNILDASTSYKPMSFDDTIKTSTWSYGGDGTLTFNGTNKFISCDNGALYFQTGKDFPSGNCTTTRLTILTDN